MVTLRLSTGHDIEAPSYDRLYEHINSKRFLDWAHGRQKNPHGIRGVITHPLYRMLISQGTCWFTPKRHSQSDGSVRYHGRWHGIPGGCSEPNYHHIVSAVGPINYKSPWSRLTVFDDEDLVSNHHAWTVRASGEKNNRSTVPGGYEFLVASKGSRGAVTRMRIPHRTNSLGPDGVPVYNLEAHGPVIGPMGPHLECWRVIVAWKA